MARAKNILVVDDNATNRKLLRAILEAEEMGVVEASDGREALDILAHQPLDLIISDIMMPRMDGYQLCLEVRKSEHFRSIPFIIYTSTFSSPGDEKLAIEMGADRYIRKPAPANAILNAIRELETRSGPAPIPSIENQQEVALMKEYSHQLVAKLEERNVELTQLTNELQATDAKLRHLLAHSPAVIYGLKIEGRSVVPYVVSENITELLGFTVAETLRYEWWVGQLHPEDRERAIASISETLNEATSRTEYRIRHKDDNRRLIRGPAGQPKEFIGVWVDITERKRAEAAVQENEERYRSLVELSPDAIFIQSDGKFVFLNGMGAKLFGAAEPRALLGKSIVEFVHSESRGFAQELFKQLEENQKRPSVREIKLLRTDGSVVHTEIAAAPLSFQGRAATQVVVRDITERKRHELRLALQHGVTRILMETASLTKAVPQILRAICNGLGWDIGAFWVVDPAKTVLRHQDVWHVPALDPSQVEMLTHEFTFEKGGGLLGRVWATNEPAWVPDVTRDANFRRKPAATQLGLHGALLIPIQVEKETIGVMEFFSREVRPPDAGTPSILRDLGDQLGQFIRRKQSEQALRDSEKRYRDLFDHANDHVLSVTAEGRFVYVNRACREALSYSEEEIARMSIFDLVHSDSKAHCREVFQRVMSGEKVDKADVVLVSKAGKKITVEGSVTCKYVEGKPVAAQCIFRDVTERKKLEEQLRQTQKMEAIGQLAGGIAHDFNNILGCVFGYIELAAMEAASNTAVQENLQEVLKAGQRAKELVLQILTFSRQQEQERKPMKLQPVIKEALKLLRASLPSTIEIRADIPSEAPAVLADATQIHQIVMNLCTNAAHAMSGRGQLSLELKTEDIDEEVARTQPDLRVGRYVALSVSDTGCGMNRATLERIFEPFFTTKGPGEGTGLGLAVVHGIMKSHEGAITVYSEPGKGTTFRLYFPAHQSSATETTQESGAMPHGNGEHILFVDDEPSLAFLGKKMLERVGYHVIVKTKALEALAAFRAEAARYDLVITDLTMPSMTGADLASELLKIRPDLPIILVTGFGGAMNSAKAQALGIRELLMKPVTAQSLAEAAHSALTLKTGN
jgi:PAS domain S-box-containing protein